MAHTILVTDYAPDSDSTDPFRFTAVVKGDRKRRRGGTGPNEATAIAWLLRQFPATEQELLRGATIERATYRP